LFCYLLLCQTSKSISKESALSDKVKITRSFFAFVYCDLKQLNFFVYDIAFVIIYSVSQQFINFSQVLRSGREWPKDHPFSFWWQIDWVCCVHLQRMLMLSWHWFFSTWQNCWFLGKLNILPYGTGCYVSVRNRCIVAKWCETGPVLHRLATIHPLRTDTWQSVP